MRTLPKIIVKWSRESEAFIATHPNTNVKGYGLTPGDAVRNWQWWWAVPV